MEKWDEFIEKAEELGQDLDLELDWEEIQEKRKKRRFLLWFNLNRSAVFVGLMFLLLGGLLLVQSKNDKLATATEAVADISTSVQKVPSNNKNTKQNAENPAKTVVPTSGFKTQGQANKIEKGSSEEIISSIVLPIKVEKQQPFPVKNTNQTLKVTENIQAIPTENQVAKTLENIKDNHKFTDSNLAELPSVDSKKEQTEQLSVERSTFKPLSSIATLEPMLIKPIRKVNIARYPARIMPQHSSKWGIGIRSTYARPSRKIQGSEATSSIRRNKQEQFLEAIDWQIQVQKFISKRFYLSSGIAISKYRSKFVDKYQLILTNVAFDNQVTEAVIKNGVLVESRGTVFGSRTELHSRLKYQQYVDVSIPIQLGLYVPLNRTWSLKAASGLNYSLYHLNKGKVIASATSIGTYASLGTLNYRTKGLLQSASNIELVKSLPRNLDITLGGQIKYDLNNRLTGNTTINDKFQAYGITLGLMKKF